tara:strand:+ start:437 stop:877 length:441 start_codon:yes stop_codon:yes gene_type:complete
MALPVTDQLITQMMTENVRTQPTTPMEGNVSRPMIVADLLSAMRDVNFSQLMEQYGNIAGSPSKKSTPMTQGLMKEQSPQVPPTPLKQDQVQATEKPQTQEQTPQIEEEIQVPTPMKNAMAMNTLAPTGSIEEDKGLMSNTSQQIA